MIVYCERKHKELLTEGDCVSCEHAGKDCDDFNDPAASFKKLQPLEEYNKQYIEKLKKEREGFNGLRCPECGSELKNQPGTLCSNPPQQRVVCPVCNFTGYRYV